MSKRLPILLLLLLLSLAIVQLTNFSSANYFPYPGPDLPRIYIKSSGDVEPATAPIERSGNTYKLTGDIVLYTVEIQHDNIVLDGAGHTIRGNASWMGYGAGNNGVIMTGRKNVNVTGLRFEGCYAGVRIISSSEINLFGNSFTNSTNMGVVIQGSTLVMVEENIFTDLRTDFNTPAIKVNGTNNTVRNNIITGSTYGIGIEGSSNMVLDNRIEVVLPIILDKAGSNVIAGNNITGHPGQNYRGNEGIALFTKCSNNLIVGNSIVGFVNQAFRIVWDGSNNTVYGNYMANNGFAIVLQEGAVNNMFYGNTFAADSCNVSINDAVGNFWDNGTIGNFWGDYTGVDSNGDGIGDEPYIVKGFVWSNEVRGLVSAPAGQDNYPLMAPVEVSYNMGVDGVELDVFELPKTTPFPTAIVVVAVAVLVLGACLLVYFKKHKRNSTKDV